MKYIGVLLILLLTFGGCKIQPKPIVYGSDACHYCSMTIVDKQHAAEYVTDTGKAFKFDSIECMMNDLEKNGSAQVSLFLVNSFEAPGRLIDATQATYLISPNIPSPMGAFLSAFESKNAAEMLRSEQEGKLFAWQELKERFKVQKDLKKTIKGKNHEI